MSRTPIMLTALESWPIELLILSTILQDLKNLEFAIPCLKTENMLILFKQFSEDLVMYYMVFGTSMFPWHHSFLIFNVLCWTRLVCFYQSNNLEYTVFDKASRLKAAASGSRGLVMLPSGVTMTRLQSESSSAFASHLNINMLRETVVEAYELYRFWWAYQSLYMNNSAAVWRWKSDLSSFNLEESTSFPLTKSMFPRWRIAATTRKIASCEGKFYLTNYLDIIKSLFH